MNSLARSSETRRPAATRITFAWRVLRHASYVAAVVPLLAIAGCGDPGTAAGCADLAEKRLNDGKPAAALRLCDKAIEMEPDNFRAYNLRAIVHQGLGNSKQSIADWTRTIELAPDDSIQAAMYALRSDAYQAFGDPLNMARDRVTARQLELSAKEAQ